MASSNNQAESLPNRVGHQYGEIHVHGNAMLGDHGHMDIIQAHGGNEEQKRAVLINTLDFSGANAKRQQLQFTEIGASSFDWVKDTGLPQWLQSGKTPFWISGKPGSGKSTLMRYLVDSQSTQYQLDSSGDHWTILQFFYDYRAGSEVANTEVGMLRLFLLQLIQSVPSTAVFLDSKDIRRRLANSTADEFIDLLAAAIRSKATRVCAFIDGLDEYDGNLWELSSQLEILRDRTGMKMCLASRPEPELENAFRGLPTITMQNHNDASIEYYIQRKMLQFAVRHPAIRETFTPRVQTVIREKAQGVMLWAKLVIDEMLETHNQSTTEEDLFALLDTFPPELERLYDRLLEKVPEGFRGDAILVLNLVANNDRLEETILFEAIGFIYRMQTRSLFFGSTASMTAVGSHIKSSLGRMIDFIGTKSSYDNEATMAVKLIHETLATHLRRSEWFRKWLPKGAEHYFGPCAWAHVSLDVLGCAIKEDALDTSALRLKLDNQLRSQREWARVHEASEKTSMLNIFFPYWKSLKSSLSSRLLCYCLSSGIRNLKTHPVVVEARLDLVRSVLLSDLGSLHLKICDMCSSLPVDLPHVFAKIRRLRNQGRLDLVFAVAHGLVPYLHHELAAPELQSKPIQVCFDMLVWYGTRISSDDLHPLLQHFAKHGFYMNGRHLCLPLEHVSSFMVEMLSVCALYTPANSWSTAHDEDCQCSGTSQTLIWHWCQPGFGFHYKIYSDLLGLHIKAGVDVNSQCDIKSTPLETIFDISATNFGNGDIDLWIWKFLALIEHGVHPQLSGRRGDALSRATMLRWKCSMYNRTIGMITRKENHSDIFEVLDNVITALKHFKKTDIWPAAELEDLERLANM